LKDTGVANLPTGLPQF